MKKRMLLSFLFICCFIFSAGCIIASADETTTQEQTTQQQIEEETTTIEPDTDPEPHQPETTLTDINTSLKVVIFSVSFVGGCLIAQGFSFWKW